MTDQERYEKSRTEGFSAFPTAGYSGGMTLRDWFAGQALVGYIAAHAAEGILIPDGKKAAQRAYQFADAMLEARKGQS